MFDEIKKKFGLTVVEKDLLHEIWGTPYQSENDDKQRNQNQTIDSGIKILELDKNSRGLTH